MNKLLLIALLFVNPALAEGKAEKSNEELCKEFSDTSGKIMWLRQDGMDMAELYMMFDSKLHKGMVKLAYESPHWHTKDRKEREINKFKNNAFLGCVEQLSKADK